MTSPLTIAELRERYGDDHVFLTRKEAAQVLRRSVASLERWAREGTGPAYDLVGGLALYPLRGLRKRQPGRAA